VKPLILKSPAKINLYLEILNKRPDGYHNLKTIFEKVNLCDQITLKPRPDALIKLSCTGFSVPRGSSNLAWRAAEFLRKRQRIEKGLDIKIKKSIPPASGLGGGSSNAACVLLGLNRLWRLGLSKSQLINYAKELGSDVAFFIQDYPFALASSRGDKIKPLDNINSKFWHILVVPHKEIPTKLAYELWDKNKNHRLTTAKRGVRITLLALQQNSLKLFAKGFYNSFTEISQRLCPDILEIKKKMEDAGVKAVSMSGKGPAVFGIVSTGKEAIECKRQLKNGAWSVFIVKTF